MQKLIHFLDISIFNKCEIKLFLFGSQQLIGKAQVLFYLGTKITLSDYPFFFFFKLYLKMKITSFSKLWEMDVHLTINTAGQSVSFVPIYLRDDSSTAKEPTKILLLTGALCPFLVLF